MNDYSFSYSVEAPAQNSRSESLWSFNRTDIFPGPGEKVFLHSRHTGAGMLVQPDVVRALELCAPFRTLDAHTLHVTNLLPALKPHAQHTRQTLLDIGNQGLMESSKAAWSRLTNGIATDPEDTPCRIFILTCDRPEALKRLLLPLVSQLTPDTIEGLWIIDDSRSHANTRENSSIVVTGQAECAVPIHYFGEDARLTLINHLSDKTPENKASILWLLDRSIWGNAPTYGLARNLALLMCVGKRALILDDDTLPEAISPPKMSAPMRFAEMNQREANFYSSSEELERHALVMKESPVKMMIETLGVPLGSLLQRNLSDHKALEGMNGAHIARYERNSRILLSMCGSWGDTGSAGLNWLLSLPAQSIQSLLKTGVAINELLSPQHCWAGHPGPAITPFGAMSQWTGVDHRTLLPPYLPAGRNEDLLFGIMLQRLHPEAAVFNSGWAIRHAPINHRDKLELTPANARPGISLLAEWLGREPRDQHGLSPERRLAGLSEEIIRLTQMSDETRLALIRGQLVARRCALLKQCVAQIESLEKPSNSPASTSWQRFLTQSRDHLFKGIQTGSINNERDEADIPPPIDFRSLENHGNHFAHALQAWPVLCRAAMEAVP
jgi:hypothetical protein